MKHQHDGIVEAYAGGADRPLPGYLALLSTYAVVGGGPVAAARKRTADGVDLPDWSDLARVSVATYRLSRVLTKASITSALRARLVRYKGRGAPGEVAEEVAPEAKRHTTTHALAELVTCPYCLGQWVATFLVTGQVLAPRFTKVATSILAVSAASDALQLARAALEKAALDEPAPSRPAAAG